MRKAFTAQHPTEAYFLKGLLESEGIAAEVRGEALFGARGEAPVTADTLPSIWVLDDSQFERALEILRNRQEGAPREVWECPNCGELLEPQFSTCWKCGMDNPKGTPP
jgi:hypothetical protein